jgi:hypothetical protein
MTARSVNGSLRKGLPTTPTKSRSAPTILSAISTKGRTAWPPSAALLLIVANTRPAAATTFEGVIRLVPCRAESVPIADTSSRLHRDLLDKCSEFVALWGAACYRRDVGRGYDTGKRVVDFLVRRTKLVLTERTAASCSTWVDRKCSYASMLAATIRNR